MMVQSKLNNILGSSFYSDQKDAYVQYTLEHLVEGWYDLYFWNIRFPDTAPVKMTATVHTAKQTIEHISLRANGEGKMRSGRWEKIGTYYFMGTGAEYLRLISTGEFHARIADVRLRSLRDGKETIIGTNSPAFRTSGKWTLSFYSNSQSFTNFLIQQNVLWDDEQTAQCTHSYLELVFVKEGKCRCKMEGKWYPLYKNSLLLIQAGASHVFENQAPKTDLTNIFIIDDYYSYISNLFSGFLFEPILKESLIYLEAKAARHIDEMLEYLLDIRNNLSSRQLLVLGHNTIMELFSALYCGLFQKEEQIPPWLAQARREMRKPENLFLGTCRFIALTGKTREHVGRCMKKYYHESISEYINALRIQHAYEQLKQTNQPVLDIIYESGFTSVSHFYKLFFKHYKMVPSQVRKH